MDTRPRTALEPEDGILTQGILVFGNGDLVGSKPRFYRLL